MNKKIKVSADTILSILTGIMNDPEVNYEIEDISAPEDWVGEKIQDVLNVKYYTFKHRPMNTETLVKELMKQGRETNALYGLTRSFCILSLSPVERVYSKDKDIITVSANLEYWVQTDKVKLLEDMWEDISIATNGIRIPVQIGTENRQVLIAPGSLTGGDIEEDTELGEMSVYEINVDFVFYENATSKSDYKVEVLMPSVERGVENWVEIPVSSLSIGNTYQQKSIPYMNRPKDVGNVNLSRAKAIVLTFDGYKNSFIDELTDNSFLCLNSKDNNKEVVIKITRNERVYTYNCIVKEHSVQVEDNTGNEVHSLTLTIRGI